MNKSDEINNYQVKNSKNENFEIIKTVDTTNKTRKTLINSKNYIDNIKKVDNPYNKVSDYIINKDYASANAGDDLSLLAHLIESEAGNEPYTGKLAVGSVVMNRSRVDGENIAAVIFRRGQFDGVNTNNFKIAPSADSLRAAESVLNGQDIIPDAYYFANLNLCSPSFAKDKTFIARIGDHWFFRKD